MVCTNCFDTDFITVKKSLKIQINGVEKVLNDVEKEECPSCGYSIFTQKQAIALEKRRIELEYGSKPVLTPYQLRLLRNVLNMTLDQVSDILQIGKNSYGRWERGASEITPSMNLLVHSLIDRIPVAKVNLIETERSKKITEIKKVILSKDSKISLGKYIKDILEKAQIVPLVVCDQVDIQEDILRKIENNKIDVTKVHPEKVYALAKFFKTSFDELKAMIVKSIELYQLGDEVSYIHTRVDNHANGLTQGEEDSLSDILEAIADTYSDEQPNIEIDPEFLDKLRQYFESERQVG